jgi:DNA repair protein RadA/Sms
MRDRAVPHDLAAVGEISLAGEVRPVASARQRASEAARLGYRALLDDELGSVRAAVERAMVAASGARERELDAAF